MAPYTEIFAVAMAVNVSVTLISSGICQKYPSIFPCFASYRSSSNSNSNSDDNKKESEAAAEESNPLVKGGDADDNKEEDQVAKHKILLFKYLCVYLLATMSDWFQGPYVYALYSAYGFSQHDIAVLFVAGFGSSMVFGSFVGGMADSGGRKKYVVIFSIVYALSCITKHFKHYWILMVGRLLGGVATSLLFSVFDSWLIKAHSTENLDKFISKSFSAASYGNSIIAILTGLIANQAASFNEMTPLTGDDSSIIYMGGYLNPFDAALCALALCGGFALTTWKENYGEQRQQQQQRQANSSRSPEFITALKNAFTTTMQNTDILYCGIISSLFEGSMYVFVFMWTPMLTNLTKKAETEGEEDEGLPFGLIFSTFMVCCMVGSSFFAIMIEKFRCEKLGVFVFIAGSCAMGVIYMATSDTVCFIAMNVFEACVGMYFPIMGTMKSGIVPENQRSAIYNLYRIPLNFIVLMSLLTNLTPQQSFMVNTAMLGCAAVLQTKVATSRMSQKKHAEDTEV